MSQENGGKRGEKMDKKRVKNNPKGVDGGAGKNKICTVAAKDVYLQPEKSTETTT